MRGSGPLLDLGKELELLCSFSPGPTRLGISPAVLLTPMCPLQMLFPFSLLVSHLTLFSPSELFSCAEYLGPTQDPLGEGESTSLKSSWLLFGQLGYSLPRLSKMSQEDCANESDQEKAQHTAEVHGCYCHHTRGPNSKNVASYFPFQSSASSSVKGDNTPTACILDSFESYTG